MSASGSSSFDDVNSGELPLDLFKTGLVEPREFKRLSAMSESQNHNKSSGEEKMNTNNKQPKPKSKPKPKPKPKKKSKSNTTKKTPTSMKQKEKEKKDRKTKASSSATNQKKRKRKRNRERGGPMYDKYDKELRELKRKLNGFTTRPMPINFRMMDRNNQLTTYQCPKCRKEEKFINIIKVDTVQACHCENSAHREIDCVMKKPKKVHWWKCVHCSRKVLCNVKSSQEKEVRIGMGCNGLFCVDCLEGTSAPPSSSNALGIPATHFAKLKKNLDGIAEFDETDIGILFTSSGNREEWEKQKRIITRIEKLNTKRRKKNKKMGGVIIDLTKDDDEKDDAEKEEEKAAQKVTTPTEVSQFSGFNACLHISKRDWLEKQKSAFMSFGSPSQTNNTSKQPPPQAEPKRKKRRLMQRKGKYPTHKCLGCSKRFYPNHKFHKYCPTCYGKCCLQCGHRLPVFSTAHPYCTNHGKRCSRCKKYISTEYDVCWKCSRY